MERTTGASKKGTRRACPICGGAAARSLHHQEFSLPHGHPLADGYDVVACQACNFVFADTIVGQADYDRFYAMFSKYEDQVTGTGGGATPWDDERLRVTAQYIGDYLPDRSARILDVGCANGALLGHLRKLGFTRIVGIDPSMACVANTRKLAIEAHPGTFGVMEADVGLFDCAIVSHVLEHVQVLAEAGGFLAAHLAENGTLYAEVPDASRYGEFLFAPFQDFNTEHINHFSPAYLNALLQSFSLERVASGTKTILSSPDSPYPAAYGIWRKQFAGARAPGRKWPDTSRLRGDGLCESIEHYIERSTQLMTEVVGRIASEVAAGGGRRAVFWGTGQLTMKLLAHPALREIEILSFVDGNASNWGKVIRGVPVVGPAKLASVPADVPVVIGSMLHHEAIVERIRGELKSDRRLILLRGF